MIFLLLKNLRQGLLHLLLSIKAYRDVLVFAKASRDLLGFARTSRKEMLSFRLPPQHAAFLQSMF